MKLTLKKTEIKILKKPDINRRKKDDTEKNKKPIFKRLEITPSGSRAVGIVQNEYEQLWKRMSLIYSTTHESNKALDHLRESCMWLCRGVAMHNEIKIETDPEEKTDDTKSI
jgi:hypothetical protein